MFIFIFIYSVHIPNSTSNPVSVGNAPNTPPPSPAAEVADTSDGGEAVQKKEQPDSTSEKTQDSKPLKKDKNSSLGKNICKHHSSSLPFFGSVYTTMMVSYPSGIDINTKCC